MPGAVYSTPVWFVVTPEFVVPVELVDELLVVPDVVPWLVVVVVVFVVVFVPVVEWVPVVSVALDEVTVFSGCVKIEEFVGVVNVSNIF